MSVFTEYHDLPGHSYAKWAVMHTPSITSPLCPAPFPSHPYSILSYQPVLIDSVFVPYFQHYLNIFARERHGAGLVSSS